MIQYFSQKFFFTFHCHGYSPTVKQENLLIIITTYAISLLSILSVESKEIAS